MNATDVLFGELRSLLQESPSAALWERLCAHLDLWPQDALAEVAIPYAADHLARWPDALERPAPVAWLTPLVAPVQLANALHLRGEDAQLIEGALDMTLLRRVHTLAITGGESAGRALLRASNSALLGQIAHLRVPVCGLDDYAMRSLMRRGPHMPLRSLDLSLNLLADRGLSPLTWSHHCNDITTLDLSGNAITADGVRALLRSAFLTNLTHLTLRGARIDDAGAALLAAEPNLARLTHIDLSHNLLTAEGFHTLARSPYLHESLR